MNIHWRRRRNELLERPRRQRVDATTTTLILTLIAGALATATSGLSVFVELNQLGPSVGSMLVFRRADAITELWRVHATIDDGSFSGTGRSCELSPAAMIAGHGSIVVEARRMTSPPVYRVHWAGQYTARDAGNCGAAADLVLSRSDLMRLADVTGGFDINLGKIGP
jgi:hypothetical protein